MCQIQLKHLQRRFQTIVKCVTFYLGIVSYSKKTYESILSLTYLIRNLHPLSPSLHYELLLTKENDTLSGVDGEDKSTDKRRRSGSSWYSLGERLTWLLLNTLLLVMHRYARNKMQLEIEYIRKKPACNACICSYVHYVLFVAVVVIMCIKNSSVLFNEF